MIEIINQDFEPGEIVEVIPGADWGGCKGVVLEKRLFAMYPNGYYKYIVLIPVDKWFKVETYLPDYLIKKNRKLDLNKLFKGVIEEQ